MAITSSSPPGALDTGLLACDGRPATLREFAGGRALVAYFMRTFECAPRRGQVYAHRTTAPMRRPGLKLLIDRLGGHAGSVTA